MLRTLLLLSGLLAFCPSEPLRAALSGQTKPVLAPRIAQPGSDGSSSQGEGRLAAAPANADPLALAVERHSARYREFRDPTALPPRDLFALALTGYEQLQRQGRLDNERYLTVIDFRLPSSQERLWVLDMVEQRVVLRSLVAHGQHSGHLYANELSNVPGSYQSSRGFYLARETYTGKHGLSLRLDGLEPGFNSKARERAIVVHGADYVSESFIRQHGRLGRSQGCPAVPRESSESLIQYMQGGSCLFIFEPGDRYLQRSHFLQPASLAG
jgi:hypothetical protein